MLIVRSMRGAASRAVLTVLGFVGLAACSPGGMSEVDVADWRQPDWMAEQAQQREEYQVDLQSCLDAKGWDVTVNASGGVDQLLSDADMERFPTDLEGCRRSMGLPVDMTPPSEDQLREQYGMLLDVRECLIAQGLRMSPAESEDTWLDATIRAYGAGSDGQGPPEFWLPYDDPAFTALPMDRQRELERECPQPWSAG